MNVLLAKDALTLASATEYVECIHCFGPGWLDMYSPDPWGYHATGACVSQLPEGHSCGSSRVA
jgi:hypothetical protein